MRPYITITLGHGGVVKVDGCGDCDDITKMVEGFLLVAINRDDKLSEAVGKALANILARLDSK